MSQNQILAESAAQDIQMLSMTLADFSEADLLARPCAGANHTAWQLGHLIVAETNMIGDAAPGAMPELPAGFAAKFSKATASVDDPKAFPKKQELLDLLGRQRKATVKWITSLSTQDMAKPSPESIRNFAPTLGNLAAMMPVHVAMHLGQIQVIRRKLGKPILF